MKDFLDFKIDGEELCGRVFGLGRALKNKFKKFQLELISGKVKNFQPDKNSEKMAGFLTGFFCECDYFMKDYENDEFYTSIQNGFLNLQEACSVENEKTQNFTISEKYCDLDDSFFQSKIDLDQLVERSYQILFLVSLAASGFLLLNLF